IRTGATRILREPNAAMGQELRPFNLPDGVVNQLAELAALPVGNRGVQILDLDQALAHEDHLSNFRDAGNPGVADQLRVKSQESIWLFRIPGGSGFPFEQTATTVELS